MTAHRIPLLESTDRGVVLKWPKESSGPRLPEVEKARQSLAWLHGMAEVLQDELNTEKAQKVRWRALACIEAFALGVMLVGRLVP